MRKILTGILLVFLTCSGCGHLGFPPNIDIGKLATPADLSLLPGLVSCTLGSGQGYESTWFHFVFGDSVVAAGPLTVTLQIGGEPGRSKTADIWADIGKWVRQDEYIVIVKNELIDSGNLHLEIKGIKASFRLWDLLIDGCDIMEGTLVIEHPDHNTKRPVVNIVIEHVLKGDPMDSFLLPEGESYFDDGEQGVWLLHPVIWSRGSDDPLNYKLIRYIPLEESEQFLDRVGLGEGQR